MFLIFSRKKAAVTIGVVIIACALAINYGKDYFVSNTKSVATVANQDELPEMGDAVLVSVEPQKTDNIKNEREIIRSKVCELLNKSIDNPNTSNDSKLEAEQKLISIAECMDSELTCESLLALKGFENAVVFISDGLITVSVESNGLNDEDIAKINDVIFGQTGNNNIKIVEVN